VEINDLIAPLRHQPPAAFDCPNFLLLERLLRAGGARGHARRLWRSQVLKQTEWLALTRTEVTNQEIRLSSREFIRLPIWAFPPETIRRARPARCR
jgi:hypothetical protein